MRIPTRTAKSLAATALAAVVVMTAAGCSDDGGASPSPSAQPTPPASASPNPTPSTPSTNQNTPPPTVPAVATSGLTVTAAEAFVRFYLAAVDHLVATGDGSVVRQWADKGCEACTGLLTTYESTYKNGGSVTGDLGTRITAVEEARLIRDDTAAVQVKATEGRLLWRKSASDEPTIVPGGPYTLDTTLAAQNGHWVMYEMVMKK